MLTLLPECAHSLPDTGIAVLCAKQHCFGVLKVTSQPLLQVGAGLCQGTHLYAVCMESAAAAADCNIM